MSLASCFADFLAGLSCAVLQILRTFLTMLNTLITAILLKKLLDVANLIDSKLAYFRTILALLSAVYGSILSTLDILGDYIKQYDYCTDVGEIMSGAKQVLNDKMQPFLKSAREIRDYLLLGKLKELEIEELQNLQNKVQEMINAIGSEISKRC